MYDLYNQESLPVNEETWATLVRPGGTITMQYQTPPAQDKISANTPPKKQSNEKARRRDITKQPLSGALDHQQLKQKHNPIKRRKLKERATKAAKAKATTTQSIVKRVDTERRLRGRTFVWTLSKEQKGSEGSIESQPSKSNGIGVWHFHPEQHFVPRTLH